MTPHARLYLFIHVKSRQVVLSPPSQSPNEAWVAELADRFVREARGKGLKVQQVQRDRDTKFAPAFDIMRKRKRVKVVRNRVRSPNTNASVVRFIETLLHKCLGKFLIFGETHLDHLGSEFVAHDLEDRPHPSLGHEPILKLKKHDVVPIIETPSPTLGEVRYRIRLGGLLKSSSRMATSQTVTSRFTS